VVDFAPVETALFESGERRKPQDFELPKQAALLRTVICILRFACHGAHFNHCFQSVFSVAKARKVCTLRDSMIIIDKGLYAKSSFTVGLMLKIRLQSLYASICLPAI
jgi:hypothetical protein